MGIIILDVHTPIPWRYSWISSLLRGWLFHSEILLRKMLYDGEYKTSFIISHNTRKKISARQSVNRLEFLSALTKIIYEYAMYFKWICHWSSWEVQHNDELLLAAVQKISRFISEIFWFSRCSFDFHCTPWIERTDWEIPRSSRTRREYLTGSIIQKNLSVYFRNFSVFLRDILFNSRR